MDRFAQQKNSEVSWEPAILPQALLKLSANLHCLLRVRYWRRAEKQLPSCLGRSGISADLPKSLPIGGRDHRNHEARIVSKAHPVKAVQIVIDTQRQYTRLSFRHHSRVTDHEGRIGIHSTDQGALGCMRQRISGRRGVCSASLRSKPPLRGIGGPSTRARDRGGLRPGNADTRYLPTLGTLNRDRRGKVSRTDWHCMLHMKKRVGWTGP